MTTTEEIIKRLGVEPIGKVDRPNTNLQEIYSTEDGVFIPNWLKPMENVYKESDINRILQEVSAEYEARIAELTEAMNKYHACFDMLTDGPDDSDTALAIRWLNEGKALREKILSASSPITALEDERKKAKREALLEAADFLENYGNQYYKAPAIHLRRMADGIGE